MTAKILQEHIEKIGLYGSLDLYRQTTTWLDGTKCFIGYFYEDENKLAVFHREDGPAITHYDQDGNLTFESWKINGLLHRTDGPALIRYKYKKLKNGKYRRYAGWHVGGERVDGQRLKEMKKDIQLSIMFHKTLTDSNKN